MLKFGDLSLCIEAASWGSPFLQFTSPRSNSSMPFSLIYLFFQKKIPTFFAFLRVMVWYHNHCVLCYCFWLNICAALICVTLLTFGCYGDYTAFFPAFLFSFCNFFGTLQIIRHFFFGAWNQYCSFFLNLTITNDL